MLESLDGELLGFAGLWFTPTTFAPEAEKLLVALEQLHLASKGASTVPIQRLALAAGITWAEKPLDRAMSYLDAQGLLFKYPSGVRKAGFVPELPPRTRTLLDRAVEALESEAVNSPSCRDIATLLRVPFQAVENIFTIGIECGEIIALEDGVHYTPRQLAALRDSLGDPLPTVAQLRDRLETSRRYAHCLIEYFNRRSPRAPQDAP